MTSIRFAAVIAVALAATSTSPLSASPVPVPPPDKPALADGTLVAPDVLRLRESAWRAWFAGDEATLREILPPEFIGIDMGDGAFSDLATTLAEARAFRAEGGRLVSLDFPETRAQTLGDVVVLYGRFAVVLESQGKTNELSGRLTEVFVQRSGRWWHPGWHLDLTSTP